jgi:hypothetical protein
VFFALVMKKSGAKNHESGPDSFSGFLKNVIIDLRDDFVGRLNEKLEFFFDFIQVSLNIFIKIGQTQISLDLPFDPFVYDTSHPWFCAFEKFAHILASRLLNFK